MKNKISRIDIVAFQSKIRRITIWRRQTDGIDYPTNYIAATKESAVTESSMIRAQRSQRALAGFRVDEWPFNVEQRPCSVTGCHFIWDGHCVLAECVELHSSPRHMTFDT